jgi:peptidoglycan/LPS O-acetylase OafA/YrhL
LIFSNREKTILKEQGQINSLTGLRALAAAMVIFGHILNYKTLGDFWIVKYGWTGVNFFFVLSGFLFTILYLDKFTDKKQSLKEYFLKRIFRIYPLYLLLLFITVISRMTYSWGDIISHLTMTHAFFSDYRFSINSPMWTLSVEESFYLIVPTLLYFLGKVWNFWDTMSDKVRLFVIFTLLFLFTLAANHIVVNIVEFKYHIMKWNWDTKIWSATIFGRFSEFGMGIFIGFICLKFPNSALIKNKYISNSLFVLGVISFIGTSVWLESHGGIEGASKYNSWLYATNIRGFALSATLIILSLYGNSLFNKFFSLKLVVYLGKISFALYLFHYINIGWINNLASAVMISFRYIFHNEVIAALSVYVLMNLCAAVLYHTVELPGQNYLRRRFLNIK